jgi:hypothetical protein
MSLLSFVLGWTTTSLTSGGGGATQASVSELTSRVAGIEAYLRQLPIATPQVATKPKADVAPKVTAPKTTAPKATAGKKQTTQPSPTPTISKAVKGQPCKKSETDSVFKCEQDPKTKKYFWALKPLGDPSPGTTSIPANALTTPTQTPTPTATPSPTKTE